MTAKSVLVENRGRCYNAEGRRPQYKPLHFVLSVSSSVGATLKSAGFANAHGRLVAGLCHEGF